MIRRPTIHDVAAAAGLSKSTVSLVLQGSPAVHANTRMLVRKTMADLGYVYNRAAAGLRSAKVGLIGLVINDLRNPFFTEFATSVQMALSARGYATVIANTDEDPVVQAQVIGSMIEHGVSALVISPTYGAPDAFAPVQVPTLQVLRHLHPDTQRFPFSAPDFALGSRLATQHLLAAGARNIAFAGGLPGRAITVERMQGYVDVMQENNLSTLALPGRASRAFGRQVARTLARDHGAVDAVLCFNDLTALGILAGCAELGRAVGREFRVVGCDDIEECLESFPNLTSLRCDIAGFGCQTAATLLDWLENGVSPQPETRTPISLVCRASSP
jgi:LacI family transcriptional regulator